MPFRRIFNVWSWLVVVLLLSVSLSACAPTLLPSPTPTQNPPTTQPTVPPPTATPTPRVLVICLGQEPRTLYPYGSSARSTWSALEAVYDGPVDMRGFTPQPVILQKLPTLEDGSAQVKPVSVHAGDPVVDVDGNVTSLTTGLKVLPAGCTSPDCATVWDGTSPLQMDQLTLTFQLKSDLKWSDGTPLTAADSVYSYQLAGSQDTPVSKRAINRTFSYKATDDTTVQWVGLPGDMPQRYDNRLWMPLPQHSWGKMSPKELLTAEQSSRMPVGWGPYVVQEWVAGDHIRMTKNPNYFRAGEGLPYFDTLVFRFLGQPLDNNLAALQAGECDLVDQTSLLDSQLGAVADLEKQGKLSAYYGQGPDWEHIDFGIRPASYDAPNAAAGVLRPDFFSDVRMRQAFTYCMDRQGVVDSLFAGKTSVPASFLPPDHPLFIKDLKSLPYNPQEAKKLLDEVGWKDLDGDPATPRTALSVKGVPDGSPLSVRYITTQAPLRAEVVKKLTESLSACGVQVDVKNLSPEDFYAAGPQGALFGRNFDLAQYTWESGYSSPCSLYETSQIPVEKNNWLTTNVTGYSNPAYDAACEAALHAKPVDYAGRNQDVARLYAQELPSVPLYYRLKMAVSRPDLCNFALDVSARSALWNIESLDYGDHCTKK